MAKKNEPVNLDGIDAESIIHSFRTTDHLQMVKDAKEGKEHTTGTATGNTINGKHRTRRHLLVNFLFCVIFICFSW